jgi:hypothetical protein
MTPKSNFNFSSIPNIVWAKDAQVLTTISFYCLGSSAEVYL